MDDLYTLAYWMTGVEKCACELVNCTYIGAEMNASAIGLFKIFRTCYFAKYIPDNSGFCRQSKDRHSCSLSQQRIDMKLSVLLSEICGFTYMDISEITGIPVDTLGARLALGRKLLVDELRLLSVEKRFLSIGGSL